MKQLLLITLMASVTTIANATSPTKSYTTTSTKSYTTSPTKSYTTTSTKSYTTTSSSLGLSRPSVGVKLGTLGLGLEYTKPIREKLNLRFAGTHSNGSKSDTIDGVNVDVKIKTPTLAVIADYHPFNNGFRTSAGLMYNGVKLDLKAQPVNGTIKINDVNYAANDVGSLSTDVDFNKIAPYLGIGWGKNPTNKRRWAFNAELGVMFSGSPNVDTTVTCGNAAICNELEKDVTEYTKELSNDLDPLKALPVISIGVSKSF